MGSPLARRSRRTSSTRLPGTSFSPLATRASARVAREDRISLEGTNPRATMSSENDRSSKGLSQLCPETKVPAP
ncbi:MAG: hypothetical protein EBV28_03760 [Betaproteobacteria bacterium]|nr:hypothetical protein [Betaproteobacteria bacterium]